MLAISPLRSSKDGNNKGGAMEGNVSIGADDFLDFSETNLLDSIDFDDLFLGMHDGDMLPDLEMDPELLAEFSFSNNTGVGDDSSDANNSSSAMSVENNVMSPNNIGLVDDYGVNKGVIEKKDENTSKKKPKEEIESNNDVQVRPTTTKIIISSSSSSSKEGGEKGKQSSSNSKNNNQAKRKTKVDWTPELHRRFVQAVEQLGVDKAVPSRILELMGIDCLTRHNIASHLQKYRSHRKHLLAREAEAANWTQKRHMYGVAMGGCKGGGNVSPWYPPTMGFPPITTMHPHPPFRPLHVWGHPTMDPQSRIPPMWPKHILPSTTPAWAPPPPHHPPPDTSFWHAPHQRRVGVAAIFRGDEHGQCSGSHPALELHPTKESIDAAIGDVLAKPWQALPIGLKPPSIDSVMVELQRQGIPNIPPSSLS